MMCMISSYTVSKFARFLRHSVRWSSDIVSNSFYTAAPLESEAA